jgi:hypothetical protein
MSVSLARVIRSTVSFAGGLVAVAAILLVNAGSASAGSWIGYMNWFENASGSQGGYLSGSGWGVSDLKTTISSSNAGTIIGDQLVLQPNFNTYADNPGDPYWRDNGGAGPAGNKWMNANTFEETPSIAVPNYTLSGNVTANTLNTGLYTARAFIKVLDPNNGYATVLNDSVTLPASGPFVVTSNLSLYQGLLLQVGFSMDGLHANPADAASFGSVSVSIVPEPSTYALLAIGSCGAVALRRRVRRATA